ncbi:MAG TPA: MFS transporter [Solirubrobacterales bacterium]|nr:MFS transporter [Solirubrobacterales bacterium]
MSGGEKRRLLVLGLPTFGMALSVTTISTYLPVLASGHRASATEIGIIIGTEGLMALWLPLVAGRWSDRLHTPLGGRLPFVLAGTPVMIACLCAAGFVKSTLALAVLVAVFFAGYFVAYEPYRALYPDLIPEEHAGRSQSTQAAWRGLGTGVALASGGALLSLALFLPFVLDAALLALSVGVFSWRLLAHREREEEGTAEEEGESIAGAFAVVFDLLRAHAALRMFVLANALWELALGAVKTFVVLYVTKGLGYGLGQASLIIGAVAVLVLGGALASGFVADRFGKLRVTEVSLWIYGLAMLVPGLTTLPVAIIAALPFVAVGGGTIMSLPYSLLMPLMPEDEHGVLTGLYSMSRGIGVMLGPLLAGVAIEVAGPLFASTDGYAAAWWVAGAAILLSIAPLHRLRAERADRRELVSAA